MIAGGMGVDRGLADAQDRVRRRHAADPARRPRHADRHGRRRGELDGRRRERRRARLRFGAARQPRDPAARAGGHQPLRGARRVQSGPGDPRRRCRRDLECVSRAGRRRRARRPLRPARGAARGDRAGAEGDLVQREPGALRHRARPAGPADLSRDVRARALPVVGRRRGHGATELLLGPLDPTAATTPADRDAAAIDMPMEVLFGKPPKMHRDVRRRVARARRNSISATCALQQAAFDVLRHPTVASKRFLITIGDRTVGGLQPSRPDGRAVAGAGRRLRDHAGRLRRLPRRGDGHRRAHAARPRRRAGFRPDGRRRGHHQPAGGADRARARQAQLQLDGGVRRRRRRRGALRHRARRRPGALPGAGHQRAGRQGQPVDAHPLAGRERDARDRSRRRSAWSSPRSRRSTTCVRR